MNKIKQTQLKLDAISNILTPQQKNQSTDNPAELLEQVNKKLNKPSPNKALSKQFKFQIANAKVQLQLQQRNHENNQQLEQVNLLLKTPQSQTKDQYEIQMTLIHGVMSKQKFDYFNLQTITTHFSYREKNNTFRNTTRKTSQYSVAEIGGLQLDDYQQQLYKIFDTREQIHFIFKNEMDLNIKRIRYQEKVHCYREDKDIYEAILIENQDQEEQTQENDSIQQDFGTKLFKFSFLNTIITYNLNQKSNVPPVLQRQYNIYVLLRELILNGIDYLHIQQIGGSLIHQKDNIQSDYSDKWTVLPSQYYRDVTRFFSTPQEASDSEKSTENKVRQVERKVRNLVTKIRRIKRFERENPIDHLCATSIEQLKDYRLQLIPTNQSYQVQRAMKDHLKETTNTKTQAGSRQIKGAVDKIQKADYFLKQKGQSKIFHKCWLEMRGFYLIWYHDKEDKEARGIGQLDDVQIYDEGLVNDSRQYHVKLLDRQLIFKIDKSLIGQSWRKVLSNQIGYKSYLNSLWMNCRISDRCPQISLVDYFFNENISELNLSDNALQYQLILPLNHIVKQANIIFDSLLYHQKIELLILKNSKVGPLAICQLLELLQEKRIHLKIKLLDLSNCSLNRQSVDALSRFLMNENSFALNQLLLDDNSMLGDESINILSNVIKDRYQKYWDIELSQQQQRQILKSRQHNELELLRVISLKNIGLVRLDDICEAFKMMVQKATDFQLELLQQDEQEQQVKKTISKLQRQTHNYNKASLKLISQLYQGQDAQYHGLIKIINIHLNISNNPIVSLEPLQNLIIQLDCFRSLSLCNLNGVSASEMIEFLRQLKQSLSLEILDIRDNRLSIQDITQILEAVSNNYSINLLNFTVPKDNELLQQDFECYQFFIADI